MTLPISQHNSQPTVPLTEQARVRTSQLAKDLDNALRQGYVEQNVIVRLLDLANQLLPLVIK